MACPGGCSSDTPGGESASFTGALNQYYKGDPGSDVYDISSGCSEGKAMEAGSAVTSVDIEKRCERVQGIRIIIGDTAESIQAGFEMVNKNFSTSGTQVAMASNFNLAGPVAS